MFSRAFALFAVAALGVVAQSPNNGTQAQTPFGLQSPGQLVQCKNTTIVWQGGQAPYKVSIRPVCGAGKNASEDVYSVSAPGSTSLGIPIKFPVDTPLIVSITDSANMQATAPETVVTSGDANDSCTLQTACTDNTQAPSAPVALASSGSTTGTPAVPTDQLVTPGPSTSVNPSGQSMVILYSYATPTPKSTSNTSTPTSLASQSNSAVSPRATPTFVVLGCMVFVGANLVLGLW